MGGPSKEKHPNNNTKGADKSRPEECFLNIKGSELFETLLSENAVPGTIPRNAKDTCDEDTNEDRAGLADIETVLFRVDEWKGFEKRVVNAVR